MDAPAYMIANAEAVTRSATLAKYVAAVGKTISDFGGHAIVRGSKVVELDASPLRNGVFVALQFLSVNALQGWFHSPGYSAIRPHREQSTIGHLFALEWVPTQYRGRRCVWLASFPVSSNYFHICFNTESFVPSWILTMLLAASHRAAPLAPPRAALQLEVYTSSDAYNVNTTIIYGATEAILVDVQLQNSEAAKVADRVSQLGRRLKAILITHPHPDHYDGIEVLLQRFPGTPVYMGSAGIAEFKRTIATNLAGLQAFLKTNAPDSVPTPGALPSTMPLTADGQEIDVTTDLPGDVVGAASNSFVWIPSLRAIVAGDLVFDHVHLWLVDSDAKTRAGWQASLRRLAALHPRVVIGGHQTTRGVVPTNADAIALTGQYITDFEAARATSADANALRASMMQKYPEWAITLFLERSAKSAYKTGA